MTEIANPEQTIILDTTKGEVTIELRPDIAPNHCARILELVKAGFYDGTPFHRVIDGFMAQGGDPTGTGTGGSGQNLDAEFSNEKHVRGTCSMARSQNPNSADSQFYICFEQGPWLDGQYTVWGRVIDGMDVVDSFAKGEPVPKPDSINSARWAAA